MSRPARQYRLPKRTDYMLIPAPLDLSLPLATEKSPLPAIIVTPSSPSSSRDFSIAFLADPPKPTLRQRITSYKHFNAPSLRTRTLVFFVIMMLLVACHLITHSLAARYPQFDLTVQTTEAVVDANMGWYGLRPLVGRREGVQHAHRNIIAPESVGAI
ncbi:hypothetical protein BDN70DRAFT_287683 [Pholiota conissans]|uniref:Transmembrane protein n=1 Tax=Pholiota conissans TaxID=109636 RepID=A0A9P6CW72_9AGAR|nr:hypothetical protein BDN70DRAFT_287683 [Pholiota conissans]